MPMPTQNETYNTLEEIQLRKDQLSESINRDREQIAALWNSVFTKREDATKGEYIATIISHGVMAIDAFMLVRKLMKNYSNVLSFFNWGTKKRRRK